nr:hypothetical protein [Ignavibacteria bacterium]
NLRSISVSNPNLSFVCGDSILQRNQGSRWVTIGPKSIFHSMNIPGNYCNAVCDGDIYIVSTESCPCTHYIQLSPVEDPVLGLLWILDVSPDLTQNIRYRVKVEVGGNVEDNTITGWTQYVDNVNGNHTDTLSNEDLTIGNQTVQVTVGASQTTTECSFIEMPLSDVGGNDIRSIKFKITPIYPESSTTFLVPIYINFLDSPGNSCLVRKYIVDCNPNPSASTSQ